METESAGDARRRYVWRQRLLPSHRRPPSLAARLADSGSHSPGRNLYFYQLLHASCPRRGVVFRVCRLWAFLVHVVRRCLSWIWREFVITFFDSAVSLWRRGSGTLDRFFYGHAIPNDINLVFHPEAMDPLTDIIRCSPAHAAWFIKTAMLFGAMSGILLSLGVALYLNRYWICCATCPKPFRWWLLSNCCLQLLQSPLRMGFYRCINELLRSTAQLSSISRQHPLLSQQSQHSGADSLADSLSTQIANPTDAPENRISNQRRLASNHRQSSDTQRQAPQRHELVHLSKRLVSLTNSLGWRASVWLSILAYAWFLVGVMWIFNTHGNPSCCVNLTEANGCCQTRSVIPDIRILTVIVLALSMSRLAVVLVIFVLALPAEHFSDFPRDPISHRRARAAETRLVDLLSFDEYWERQQSTDSSDERRNDYDLPQYLFETSSGDTILSLSSDDDQQPVATDAESGELRCQGGLPKSVINQLPILYYTHYVFPHTLKNEHSLSSVMSRWSKRKELLHKSREKGLRRCLNGLPSTQLGMRNHEEPKRATHSTLFCSLLPNAMRNSKFFHESGNLEQREFPRIDCRRDQSRSKQSKSTCVSSDSSDQIKSSSFLPSWRRIKTYFGSTCSTHTSSRRQSVAHASRPDFTGEYSNGAPLFLASCSICLDDFEENAEIRQLPCRHGFHRVCIDTWLTHSGSCPLCHTSIFNSNIIFRPSRSSRPRRLTSTSS